MFNLLYNNIKVRVTIINISDLVPRLFINYNRGKRLSKIGYNIIYTN